MSGINFGTAEEKKEYVERIGIEYRFGCEKERDPIACHLLGDWFEGVKGDRQRAFELYNKNCDDHKHAASCYRVAMAKLSASASLCEPDPKGGFERLQIGCKGKFPIACRHLGELEMVGLPEHGIAANPRQALKTIESACVDGGDGVSCWLAGAWHYTGWPRVKRGAKNEKPVLPVDLKAALRFCEMGCDKEIAQCCANASRMYRVGEGTPIDLKLADKYKQDALDLSDKD